MHSDQEDMLEQIHVEIAGEGAPALLFVHGFCCDGSDWSGVVARLSSRFRCAVLDLPGHGRSSATAPSMAAAAAAVNTVKTRCGLKPVILIGHSLGAKIIREAYRQDCQGIAGLILVDGSLYGSSGQTMRSNASAALASGMEVFLRALFGRMFGAESPPSQREKMIQRALSLDLTFARELFLDSIEWDTKYGRSTIAMLKVPTMVIQATTFDSHFRWRPLSEEETTLLIEELGRNVADFEVIRVPNAGHFIMHDAPGKTAEAIAAFARRVIAGHIAGRPADSVK